MICSTAKISENVQIGRDVSIGAGSVIGDGVRLGDNVVIEANCEIGIHKGTLDFGETVIGANALIRSGSIIYSNCTFGDHFQTGHRVTIREKTICGEQCSIGTLGDLQGFITIGDYVRLHSNVHIGQKSEIGDCVWIFPYVVLTNDPHPPSEILDGVRVDDFAVICTMSVILPGVALGAGCLIGAGAIVGKDVGRARLVVGNPARDVGDVTRIKHSETGDPAYPWVYRLADRYPPEFVERARAVFG